MGVYDSSIALAQRLIKAKGQACGWQKPAVVVTGGTPWNPEYSEITPNPIPCEIVFLMPNRYSHRMFIEGTEVPEDAEIGLMKGNVSFEPKLTDTIIRNGKVLTIHKIGQLAPNGESVLYYLAVKGV